MACDSQAPPEFQQRARAEALRQGFPRASISLECEDGRPQLPAAALTMPDHLRRRLDPSRPPEEGPPPPPVTDVPEPGPAYRP